MALTPAELQAKIQQATAVSVDGLSKKPPTLDEIRRYESADAASGGSSTGRRGVLYQRMQSTSTGDRQ